MGCRGLRFRVYRVGSFQGLGLMGFDFGLRVQCSGLVRV